MSDKMKKILLGIIAIMLVSACISSIDISGDPFKGYENAKVTIIEFSDFQCPACKMAEPVLKQIMETYGDRIKFVYKDFPLDTGCNSNIGMQVHSLACEASEAAQCAFKQGKFWEFHDKLYEKQDEWSSDMSKFESYAAEFGLDLNEFKDCINNGLTKSSIKNDIEIAKKIGVDATPMFFINGEKVVGVKAFSYFKAIIDKKLEE